MTPEKAARFFELYDTIRAIINNDGQDWEEKYYAIFSDEISGAISGCGVVVAWYDSNMTHEENVMAYWDLLTEKFTAIKAEQEGV